MKKIIFTLLTLPVFCFANVPEFPTGSFHYSDTKVFSTKHQRILNLRHPTDKKLYRDYRELGYACSRHPNSFVKCRKTVSDNPNQIEFNTEKLQALSPSFGELQFAEKINESDTVDTYEVSQNVDFKDSSTDMYKAYQNYQTQSLYLDIKTDNIKTIRFNYRDKKLILFSTQREKISKNEVLIHTIINVYQ